MATRTKKAINGAITSFAQLGISVILQALLAPLTLKIAGQEVLGAYVVIMQVIGYGLILDFGIGVAIARFLSQSFGINYNNKKFMSIFNVGRYFVLMSNILVAIFILVLAFKIDILINGGYEIISDARIALYSLSVWTIIRTPLTLYNHALNASQNMATSNIIGLISSTFRLILSLCLVYAGYGLIGLVAGNIFSEFLGLLLQKISFRKLYPQLDFQWHRPDTLILKELFAFGLTYWGVNIASVLTVGSDSILVGNLYGAAAVAIFYTTKMPSFLMIQVIYKISDNSGSAVNELLAQGNTVAIKSAYLRILRYSLLVAIPLAIGIIGFNKGVIIAWVGVNQYAGVVMSLALSCFVITQVVNHINAMVTLAVGNMRNWIAISVIIGFGTILLAYALGKFYGMQWVMVAIAIMDIPGFIFLARRSFAGLDLTYLKAWDEAIVPALFAAFPLLCWVFFVVATDQVKSFISLVTCITVYTLLWLISIYIFGINKSEQHIIKRRLALI